MVNVFLLEDQAFSHPAVLGLSELPGTRIHVYSRNPNSLSRHSRLIDSFFNYSSLDHQAFLSKINEDASRLENSILLPLDLTSVQKVSSKPEDYSGFSKIARIPSFSNFNTAEDKWLFAQNLVKHQIKSPHTVLYSEESFDQDLGAISGRCLIKPRTGSGGVGIKTFDTPDQLAAWLRGSSDYKYGQWLAQSFLPGRDIDCSVLCKDGEVLAHTIQIPSEVHRAGFAPAVDLTFVHNQQVLATAQALMRALHWNGVAHIDLRYDDRDGSLHVIEINPRYWATLLQSLCAGVNFPKLAIMESIGQQFPMPTFKEFQYNGRWGIFKTLFRYGFECSGISYKIKDPLTMFK